MGAAILAVLAAAGTDTYAAWVYVGRCPEPVQDAVAATMINTVNTPGRAGSPWFKHGSETMIEVGNRLDARGAALTDTSYETIAAAILQLNRTSEA